MTYFDSSAATATASAASDSATLTQPRSSLAAFWRRLTSISARNQSPVPGRHPDQCSASSTSDMALSCSGVKVGREDMEAYLAEVMARHASITAGWNSPLGRANPQDLSATGYLIAIDIPTLVALVRSRTTTPTEQQQ